MVLLANAATSFAGGAVAVSAAGWLSDKTGLDGDNAEDWTRFVGVGLVVFGIAVAVAATNLTGESLRRATAVISELDLLWVIATVVAVATSSLSGFGWFAAVFSGVGVFDFALLQLWLRRRMVSELTQAGN